MIDVNALIGTHDVLFVTLDTLRYDVAARLRCAPGRTPNLAAVLPGGGWEERHSPGQLHLRRPPGVLRRLPADAGARPAGTRGCSPLRFPGSETTADETCVFDAPDIVAGLARPRLPHGLHRRRRLLQQAHARSAACCRAVRREPLGARSSA